MKFARSFCLLMVLAGFVSPLTAAEPPRPARSDVDAPGATKLPARFRTHCRTDALTGRESCAGSCGSGYQLVYCSDKSFGCCHVGAGYCDFDNHLRCAPPLFIFSTPTW